MRARQISFGSLCAAILALAAPGCGSSSTSSTSGDAGDSGARLVSYHRSGGLAYSNITLVVDSDGKGVATSTGPTGKNTERVDLSSSQLEKLERALHDTPLGDLPEHRALGCADCYLYAFAYGGDRYVTDEASVPAELKPVIAVLDPIAAQAIPANLAPDLSG